MLGNPDVQCEEKPQESNDQQNETNPTNQSENIASHTLEDETEQNSGNEAIAEEESNEMNNNETNKIEEIIQDPLTNYEMAKQIMESLAWRRNYSEAAKYFLLAIEDGEIKAYNDYGLLLKSGQGFDAPNKTEAFKYFTMGANHGDKEAMRNCGIMLRDGVGVSQDMNNAKDYFSKAVSAGDELSAQLLREINARETQLPCSLTKEELAAVTSYNWLLEMNLDNNYRPNGFVIERDIGDQNASKTCLLL